MAITINGNGTISGLSTGGISNTKAIATAAMPAGSVIQVKSTTKTDTATTDLATNTWWHYTDSSLRATITPTASNSILLLSATLSYSEGTGQWYQFKFLQDGDTDVTDIIGDASSNRPRVTAVTDNQVDNNAGRTISFQAVTTAGNTTERYYTLSMMHTSGLTRTMYINRRYQDSDLYTAGRGVSTITVMEVAV